MKLSHLKRKGVINVYSGNFLGYIIDVIISLPKGEIESLIIKPKFAKRIFGFFSISNKIYVPYDNILSIGKDVILVNIIDK